MPLIDVDRDRCISCSACIQVCPMGVLAMNLMLGSGCTPFDASVPDATSPDKCIRCGHCVAVCPKAAIDHIHAPLSKQTTISHMDIPDSGTAARFLRHRRSIRVYREYPIPRETLARLLDIARFAPTGTNTQGLSYLVVSDRERLAGVTGAVIEWLERGLTKPGSRMPQSFWEPVEAYHKGRDALLRNAPHLILALTPPEILAVSRNSAMLALEYVELLAPTMGIGTCWMGILQLCAGKKYPPLMNALDVEGDREVVGAITAGYPKYSYQRLVDRNPLDVYWL